MTTALSLDERDSLLRCEGIIERGIKTFIDVGTALMAIRNSRLYREKYGTFDAYVSRRWPEMGSRRAYQLMEAAQVVENVNHGSHAVLPRNEKQCRPLVKLPRDQQQSAWARAVETAPNGRVTGEHVKRVVEDMQPSTVVPVEALFPAPQNRPDALLAAKYHLLHAALTLVAADLTERVQDVRIDPNKAREVAQLLLDSPLIAGAAAMLTGDV